MRSIAVLVIVFSSLPFIVTRPVIGLFMYDWLSYMNPHRLTWGIAYDFPFAMMVGVVFIGSWLISNKEPKKPPTDLICILVIIFTLWMTVSTAFAFNFDTAFDKWKEVMKIMVITVITMTLLTDRKRIDILLWVICGSIGFYAIKGGVFATLTGGEFLVWGPPQSLIEENNALALATIMVVPLTRYLQLQATNRYIRWGLMGVAPLMLLSAMASHSRGALLAMVAMGAFLWLKSRRKMLLGVGMVICIAVGLSMMPQKWFDRMETLETYEQDESAMGRINAWTMGFNLAVDHPIFGGGFTVYERVPWVWERYAPEPEDRHAAHSIYFEVLAYHGFVGFFLFMAIGYLSFRNGKWLVRRSRGRPDLLWARDLGGMLQVSLVGFATGGAFLNLAFYDLFWSIVAIAVTARRVFAVELAKESAPSAAAADDTPVELIPVRRPQVSFLRPAEKPAETHSFLRR